MTAEFLNCEAKILHNAITQKLHKVVHNDGWPPTALLIMHMLSTCCKLSAPTTHHLLAHGVRPIDLVQLPMNFDRRYALCIKKLYHRSHFTVDGSWNKSLHLQPLQQCYFENSGSLASACVMRRHYSSMYMQSRHTISGLLAVERAGNLLYGRTS